MSIFDTGTITANAKYHFGLDETATCFAWMLVPRQAGADEQPEFGLGPGWGTPEGYTSLDRDIQIGPLLCESVANILPSELATTIGLETTDALDATMLFPDVAAMQRERVEAQIYTGALAFLFAVPWEALEQDTATEADIIPLMAGTLGSAEVTDEAAKFEMLPWSAHLNTQVGRTTGEFCDVARFGCGRCLGELQDGVNIKLYGRTVYGTIKAPPSGEDAFGMKLWVQLDGGATRADGWANFGVIRIESGPLSGAEFAVKRSFASGEIRLRSPCPLVPDVGTVIALEEGCDRTFKMCKTKQPNPSVPVTGGNHLNFQGFAPPGQKKVVKKTTRKSAPTFGGLITGGS